jgi:glyceraldehyde-3-phosphate dehydrogenase (NADP+)
MIPCNEVTIVNALPRLDELFPLQCEIPAEHRLSVPIHQSRLLIDGELAAWDGPSQIVLSPIWTRGSDGALVPTEIGSHPKGSPEVTEAALTAAVNAYANGSGRWPTMTVADRIACTVEFTRQMLGRRDEVVRLIMWEVGKTCPTRRRNSIVRSHTSSRPLRHSRNWTTTAPALLSPKARSVKSGARRSVSSFAWDPITIKLNETFATLIPALIMGNTVLLKPPRFGVLLFYPLLEAFRNAFPRVSSTPSTETAQTWCRRCSVQERLMS